VKRTGRRGHPARLVANPEPVEGGHAEVAGEPLLGSLECRVVHLGDRRADGPRQVGGSGRGGVGPRQDQLADTGAAKLLRQARVGGDLAAAKVACGGIEERQPAARARRVEDRRAQEARLARVERLLVQDRARRDEAGDLAPDDPGAPRRFHLVADGDLEPPLEELCHVAAGRVVGDPAHGDLAVPLGARGERDLEHLRGLDCVLEEHLVEVAQPEEEDGIGVPRLHLEVLPHHRRRRLCDLCHGVLLARRSHRVAGRGSGC
jgi:hypothetical protein